MGEQGIQQQLNLVTARPAIYKAGFKGFDGPVTKQELQESVGWKGSLPCMTEGGWFPGFNFCKLTFI